MREGGRPGAVPQSLEEIRGEVSARRWRLYETAALIVAELDARIDWPRLYDLDLGQDELVGWGLHLEETLPEVSRRLRAVIAEEASGRAETGPVELEDQLHWGSRQLESGVRQAMSVLSREMVSRITGAREGPDDVDARRALAIPIAEVAGKLRNDLRKLTAFLVAGERWSPDEIELLLFPDKRQELEKSRSLKARLVETMEGFQGSDERLPIGEVIDLWRSGRALGQAALAEVDSLIRGLLSMLEPDNRRALYVDSYYRLVDWSRHLARCSEGLKERLGDEAVEDLLTKEIAAILDTDLLAEILGGELVRHLELPRDLGELLAPIDRQRLADLELRRPQRQRVLALKDWLRAAGTDDELVELAADDEELLRKVAGKILGRRQVDRMRTRGALPESMARLEPLHPLVRAAQDGLKTYLTLLYGQIQNRDLHLLAEDRREVPLAEKRLAVSELDYRLSRLAHSENYFAFEAVRHRLGGRQEVPAQEWQGLRRFLDHLRQVIAPRLVRIASFEEIAGIPSDGAARMVAACEALASLEEPPVEDQQAEAEERVEALAGLIDELGDVRVAMAAPQTVDEIEDFLDMMG